jgi:glutaredoxin
VAALATHTMGRRARTSERVRRLTPDGRIGRGGPSGRGLHPDAVLISFVVMATLALPARALAREPSTDIEVFTRAGCPRCAAAERFLQTLHREQPALHVVVRQIDRDPAALRRLGELAAQKEIAVIGVPAFHVRDELIVGFVSDESTGARIRALVEGTAPVLPQAGGACTPDATGSCDGSEDVERIALPFFGSFTVSDIGLPFFTIVMGLLDGFNPCAMWVLLFLLSLLVNVRDRAKMLLIAGTFVVASGVVYFAFMAAWLNIFILVGFSASVRVVIGVVAAVVGLVNVKDFFAWGRGFSFSIPDPAKPGIYARARRILRAENLAGALTGVIVLAVLVNTVELLCTAGFPAVYTHILTQRELPRWAYYGYLALYNVAYMLDDSIMVLTAVITLGHFKLQERGGRWLKLVSGVVLLALGLALLIRPEWLAFEGS